MILVHGKDIHQALTLEVLLLINSMLSMPAMCLEAL